MATAPRATPSPTPRSSFGCLFGLLMLPVVVVGGLVLGTVLRQDDDEPGEVSYTLSEGSIDGIPWRVEAERDIDGATCAFLYSEDDVQLSGGCEAVPEFGPIGSQTVVFGKAPDDVTTVRVLLDDGDVVEISTVTGGSVDGRFFVDVVDGDVQAESFAP